MASIDRTVEEILREFFIDMKKELNIKAIASVLYSKKFIGLELREDIERETTPQSTSNQLFLDHLIKNHTLETLSEFCHILEETANSDQLLPHHKKWSNKLKLKLTKPDIPVNSMKSKVSCLHCKEVFNIPVDDSPHCLSAKGCVSDEECNEDSEDFYVEKKRKLEETPLRHDHLKVLRAASEMEDDREAHHESPSQEDMPIPPISTVEETDGPTGEHGPQRKSRAHLPSNVPLTSEEKYAISEKFKLRSYQEELAETGLRGDNCIICAPTGSGKTLISARIISNHLIEKQGSGKVVFVVSRVPLTNQQCKHFRSYLPNVHVEGVHGGSEGKFHVMLKESDIVVCTYGILAKALKEKNTKMADISLLILDECHNLRGYSVYSQIMHEYLIMKSKYGRDLCPQVVGLTATPGTGRAKRVVMSEVRDHLLNMCALMDAPRGFSIVVRNREELDRTVFAASIQVFQTSMRTPNDPFFKIVNDFMEKIEAQILVRAAHPRNEFSYVLWVQQLQSKVTSKPFSQTEHQRQMLLLEYLEAYANMLCVYEDLTAKYALDVLEEATKDFKSSKSHHGKALYEEHGQILEVLIRIASNSSESEHLKSLSEILQLGFGIKPDSRAIVFTRTKYHAKCLNKWIKGIQDPSIKPDICVGHNWSSKVPGMSDHQQQDVLMAFKSGKVNVLVATSVLEEGLDVANCNLVIRFLYVKDEISHKQTGGRGRSDDSQHISVVPMASRSHQRELMNKYKDELVEQALKLMNGTDLEGEVARRQCLILADLDKKKQECVRSFPAEKVRLLCKGCLDFICRGSDLRLFHDTHFTLPDLESITDKSNLSKHEEKGVELQETVGMTKNRQIYCKKCGHHKWGITCDVSRPHLPDIEIPVLKCKMIIFEYHYSNGKTNKEDHPCWAKRQFEVQPYLSVSKDDDSDVEE